MEDVSILARKASFLVQVLQDLVQDLASLAYFLQDDFYWVVSYYNNIMYKCNISLSTSTTIR